MTARVPPQDLSRGSIPRPHQGDRARAAWISGRSRCACVGLACSVVLLALGVLGGCSSRHDQASKAAPASRPPAAPTSADGDLTKTASAASSIITQASTQADPAIAGEIFGAHVSLDNYSFAKRVIDMFPRPWGAADAPEPEREQAVWDNLILHYEGFRRGLTVSDDELASMIDELLKNEQQGYTRRGNPEAYQRWVTETLKEPVELLENQVRFVIQIRKLKDQLLQEQTASASDEEMQQAFLDEHHHVGGEMVVFDSRQDAETFYERVKDPERWEQMKAKGDQHVRPVSLMTLEAYRDLWSIPRQQIYAFHDLELGAVGPPMPFGKQWCVYRLLDKRTGELKDFPAQRDSYQKKVEAGKKFEAVKDEIQRLKQSAKLKVLVAGQR